MAPVCLRRTRLLPAAKTACAIGPDAANLARDLAKEWREMGRRTRGFLFPALCRWSALVNWPQARAVFLKTDRGRCKLFPGDHEVFDSTRNPVHAVRSFLTLGQAPTLAPLPGMGLRVERGFRITLFADHDLAPDTWCMTLDARGRVVVGNGQSIRTLADDNADGTADRAVEFAKLERGVMGMRFDGTSLYVAADGWLQRYDDADGDSIADGPPERLLPWRSANMGVTPFGKARTAGWYSWEETTPGSLREACHPGLVRRFGPPRAARCFVSRPMAGSLTLSRTVFETPTTSTSTLSETFLPTTATSNATRSFHGTRRRAFTMRATASITAGGSAGYQRSWPRPEYYADTVSILSDAGRGSPTGVATYRHFQFPPGYRDGLFFADWTFGESISFRSK